MSGTLINGTNIVNLPNGQSGTLIAGTTMVNLPNGQTGSLIKGTNIVLTPPPPVKIPELKFKSYL